MEADKRSSDFVKARKYISSCDFSMKCGSPEAVVWGEAGENEGFLIQE